MMNIINKTDHNQTLSVRQEGKSKTVAGSASGSMVRLMAALRFLEEVAQDPPAHQVDLGSIQQELPHRVFCLTPILINALLGGVEPAEGESPLGNEVADGINHPFDRNTGHFHLFQIRVDV